MPEPWKWPGSRWWQVDLHAHSPASHDFKDDRNNPNWDRWVSAFQKRGIDVAAVTDHNTADGISPLQDAARRIGLVLFPGVELTIDGVHLLLIMGPNQQQDDVADILSRAQVPVAERGSAEARSLISIDTLLGRCGKSAIVIGAHVNGPAGLLEQVADGEPQPLRGQQRIAILRNRSLAAVEIDPDKEVDDKWIDGKTSDVPRRITRVWGSDAHRYDDLGRRYTWIKMTDPSSGGVRLAFEDGSLSDSSRSVMHYDTPNPNKQFSSTVVESVTVDNARHIGQPTRMEFRFNPWFNAIIGGRGTGKSTIVDFCRKTLRRDRKRDLPESLRDSFDRRLRVPASRDEEGLLTQTTRIDIVYRRNGERFRLSWCQDGRAPSVVRLVGNDTREEQGDIAHRFPVRIFSQKQLFEIAHDPNALLTVIDESRQVGRADLHRSMEETHARYLACRSQARLAYRQADGRSELAARLTDVRRKLDVLQKAGRAEAFASYRRSQREENTWKSVCDSVRSAIAVARRSAVDLEVADLGIEKKGAGDVREENLQHMHKALHDAIGRTQHRIQDSLDDAERAMKRIRSSQAADLWRKSMLSDKQDFETAMKDLSEQGIDGLENYPDLLAEKDQLEQKIDRLTEAETKGADYEREAELVLAAYRDLKLQLGKRRQEYVANASSDSVRVCVRRLTDWKRLDDELAITLGTDRFEKDRTAICREIRPAASGEQPWSWDRLDAVIAKMRRYREDRTGDWEARDQRFLNVLEHIDPAKVDQLALYSPDDSVSVEYKEESGAWRKLAHGSPGQQTAALLAFVLGQGTEPIILDQPEDDLDNAVVYDLLVKRLREVKRNRQVIVVTHNPNIVVHADAEYVMSLDAQNGQTHIVCDGGLQDQRVREEICRVMEGGEEAFKKRYRRIVSSGESP